MTWAAAPIDLLDELELLYGPQPSTPGTGLVTTVEGPPLGYDLSEATSTFTLF